MNTAAVEQTISSSHQARDDRGAADAAVQNIRSKTTTIKKKYFHAQKDREMRLGGGCVWIREMASVTEKFQKLSANISGLEEKGEVFLCMCALLKIPWRDRGRDNKV